MKKAKTVSQIIRNCKIGDILVAGRRKWVVVCSKEEGLVIAQPANRLTKCELWSEGLEKFVILPGLKVLK